MSDPDREQDRERDLERARVDRRARLDAVFGDVLPAQTRDDRDPSGEGERSEDWLRAQVPPHHGS